MQIRTAPGACQRSTHQVQLYYQNGGGIALTEIVESIKQMMSGVFVAGTTVVLIQGRGRKSDKAAGSLMNPTTRSGFCADKLGGREPTVAHFAAGTDSAYAAARNW